MSGTNAWMPLYGGDFLRDTQNLNTEEKGAYLLILIAMWANKGYIDTDNAQKVPSRMHDFAPVLARISGLNNSKWSRVVGPRLYQFFRIVDGRLTQGRLLREFERTQRVVGVRRAASKNRWGARPEVPDAELSGNEPHANGYAKPYAKPHAKPHAKSMYPQPQRDSSLQEESPPTPPMGGEAEGQPVAAAEAKGAKKARARRDGEIKPPRRVGFSLQPRPPGMTDEMEAEFAGFWTYCKPGYRLDAMREYTRLRKAGVGAVDLLDAARTMAAARPNPAYRPRASEWLRQGDWRCDPAPMIADRRDSSTAAERMRWVEDAFSGGPLPPDDGGPVIVGEAEEVV